MLSHMKQLAPVGIKPQPLDYESNTQPTELHETPKTKVSKHGAVPNFLNVKYKLKRFRRSQKQFYI